MGETTDRKSKLLQDLVLYAASAAFSCLVVLAGLRHLDTNREAAKRALEHRKELSKRLNRTLIHTNPYEANFTSLSNFSDMIACDVVNPDHIDVEFESIGGLDSIKQALFELVILPLRRPQLFARGKLLGPQKGVLLYGPPGTGKTMLAKAIAKESEAVFINVRVSNLMSKWFGDAQKLVSAVFSLAYKLQPAIIFIDEVDSFLGQRRSTDNEVLTNMKTEFMALWDGFTTDQNARVMVLAATNRPTDLDEAILRRLPQAFEIRKPDCGDREKILKVILKGERIDDNIDFNRVASLCQGYTGSDLLELCKQAAYIPLRDFLQEEKNGKQPLSPRPLSQLDLEKALAASRKSKLEMSGNSRLSSWSSPTDWQLPILMKQLEDHCGIELTSNGERTDDNIDFNNLASLCHWYTGYDFLEFCKLRRLDPNRESTKRALERKKELSKRLNRTLIHTNPYEANFDMVARDAVNPDHLDVEFESIGGLDSIKQALFELVILPLRRPRLFARGKLLGPQKGVLLYGPPGTGKTMLAKAIAKESGAVFINVRVSNLMSKWFGDSQKLVSAVFSLAYKLQPAIIFIDEVDNERLTNMRTEFMALWDGITTDKSAHILYILSLSTENARVMVLAATNRPTDLDEAILRRLPQAFEIGKPDCGDREKILKMILKGESMDDNIDFNHVANLCQGYTGSDLLELCKQAAYIPLRDFLEEEKNGKQPYSPRPLSQLDLEKALAASRKSKLV
ncbi:hypothetical protein RHSIM_Rhsim02G0251500 [Rhododendron simsii]|uniref:AAA+ ATPase domain-containing protein n=1 Tax=Rhododendron simsii TaxID=118357 RepID=A0A834HD74_RHOSS|nr:hypothetical protein RHSIM_Rhsim02G0251500 [Rhododendron simsii]